MDSWLFYLKECKWRIETEIPSKYLPITFIEWFKLLQFMIDKIKQAFIVNEGEKIVLTILVLYQFKQIIWHHLIYRNQWSILSYSTELFLLWMSPCYLQVVDYFLYNKIFMNDLKQFLNIVKYCCYACINSIILFFAYVWSYLVVCHTKLLYFSELY